MIGIIDYGMGNLFSVSKALERLDAPYFISADKQELLKASALILPGVGSFRDAMKSLVEEGLDKLVMEFAASGKPLLGICLGMQLLFEESEENGPTRGFGLLAGKVERFSGVAQDESSYKVPHMGWNRLEFTKSSPILEELDNDYVYFVHSYFVNAEGNENVLAKSNYHERVAAVVGKDNIYGMQFHPEKSGSLGMQLLRNFTKLAEERTVVL
jgi:imidazole glycerol-phosphate synthase subunit HisH